MKQIVNTIMENRKGKGAIDKVIFVACGGSLAAFYPAKYFLERENRKLSRVGFYSANEFVHSFSDIVDENTLVIGCSHEGKTPETVEAMKIARQKGCATIAFTYFEGSAITEYGDAIVKYSWGQGVKYAEKKESLALKLAMEFLYQSEGYENYEKAMESFKRYEDVAVSAREKAVDKAIEFAEANKAEKVIYTVGSGASWGAAYMECICILMEMQWINSNCIHAGEFFHGPLEIVDTETPMLLFMGDGSTRALDERVKEFVQKWGNKNYIIDVKDLGINVLDNEVVEYFAPLLLSAVVDVYNQHLARVRNHPLSTRRYMWKVKY